MTTMRATVSVYRAFAPDGNEAPKEHGDFAPLVIDSGCGSRVWLTVAGHKIEVDAGELGDAMNRCTS